jgi:hypothetical protein
MSMVLEHVSPPKKTGSLDGSAELEKSLLTMDWPAYEERMNQELKIAVDAYAKGERGLPAKEFFSALYEEDKALMNEG